MGPACTSVSAKSSYAVRHLDFFCAEVVFLLDSGCNNPSPAKLSVFRKGAVVGRSEIRMTITRPLKSVFETYTQPDTFAWSDLRSVEWTLGQPWEVESRMRIEPENGFGVIIDQVVTHFEPYRRIDFISHFGGVTMMTQLRFRAVGPESTEIHSHLEFVGSFSRVAGFALGPAIENGARTFYADFKRACEMREAGERASNAKDSPEAGTGKA